MVNKPFSWNQGKSYDVVWETISAELLLPLNDDLSRKWNKTKRNWECLLNILC